MRCQQPDCGNELQPTTKFCGKCGTAVTNTALPDTHNPQEGIDCPQCGAGCKAGAKFCSKCGYQFSVVLAVQSTSVTAAPQAAPIESVMAQASPSTTSQAGGDRNGAMPLKEHEPAPASVSKVPPNDVAPSLKIAEAATASVAERPVAEASNAAVEPSEPAPFAPSVEQTVKPDGDKRRVYLLVAGGVLIVVLGLAAWWGFKPSATTPPAVPSGMGPMPTPVPAALEPAPAKPVQPEASDPPPAPPMAADVAKPAAAPQNAPASIPPAVKPTVQPKKPVAEAPAPAVKPAPARRESVAPGGDDKAKLNKTNKTLDDLLK